MLTSQVATFDQGKGQRSQRTKNRTEPFPRKIGRGILNIVALALTVTELFNKVCEKVEVRKGLERKQERTETPGQKQNVSPYFGDT